MCTPRTIFLRTADGWRLGLRRLVGGPASHQTPVLLLHGFGANGFALWHPDGRSLGRHLTAQGFDVWLLEFRGTRSSRPPPGAVAPPIRVDDKLCHDLPAAVARLRAETGAAAVDVVGHSLGGTILYGYLSHFDQRTVRRCVTLAAPLRYRLPRGARWLGELCRSTAARRVLPERLPMRGFAHLGVRTNIVLPARPHFNLRNVERAVLLRMMREGIEDPSLDELHQLARWSRQRRLTSWDGRIDYGARLAELRLPVLLLGGAADAHVAPRALEQLQGLLRSCPARLTLLGKQSGARFDYGHTDLLLGREAELDVFPLVSSWLAAP